MKAINCITFLFLFFSVESMAQNIMTSSPYSMFGLGEISSGQYGQNLGMGGVSVGMRNSWLINTDNPAGLTGLDSCMLFAEASAFIKWESYKSGGSGNDAFTGNMSSFALAGRMMPKWYMAAGLNPYSSVGYYFKSSQPLEGSPGSEYISTFEGKGGLSKVYVSSAYQLLPFLSLGVNLNYIFGNITQTETQGSMSVAQKMYAKTFYADFGLQYHRTFGRNLSLSMGAVYGYSQELSLSNSIIISNSTSESEQTQKNINQYLPQYVGIGGALDYKKWTYALDYIFHQYSLMKSEDARITFDNSHELRAGICYSPKEFYYTNNYWKSVTYKVGFDVSTPYLNIRRKSGIGWRASVGLGLPVMKGLVNASFFYDYMKLDGNTLQKDVFGFSVTYTINELFHKVKL